MLGHEPLGTSAMMVTTTVAATPIPSPTELIGSNLLARDNRIKSFTGRDSRAITIRGRSNKSTAITGGET